MPRAGLPLAALTVLALALGAGTARADSYCVPPATGCTVDGLPTVQAALDAAGTHAGADTVRLGAATYVGPFASVAAGDLEIVGAGPELTRIATASGNALTLGAGVSGALAVRRLGLRITGGTDTTGLRANSGSVLTVEDVAVDRTGSPTDPIGLFFEMSAAVSRVRVALSGGTCVISSGMGVSLDDLQLDGCGRAVNVQGGALAARRLRIASPGIGVQALGGATATVDDSLIRAPNGLFATAYAAFRTTLTARHVTLSSASVGTAISAFNVSTITASDARVVLRDSIVSGYFRAVERTGSMAAGQAAVQTSGSDIFPSTSSTQEGQGPTWTPGVGDLSVAPGFVSATDFRLANTSPLLDLRAAPLGAGEPPVDLDGLPRTVNGARDLGAYERQTFSGAATGTPTDITMTSATFRAVATTDGLPIDVGFEYGPTTAYGTTTASTTVPTGPAPVAQSATITGLTPGTMYHVRAVASSPRGPVAGDDVTFTTVAPPGAPVVIPPRPPPPPPRTVLRLRSLRATPNSFPASRSTSLRFTASAAGQARVTVRREVAGRRRGRACVASTTALRRARRCTRLVAVKGSKRVTVQAGANRVAFRSPDASRLRPGRYVLRLAPVPAAGQAAGPAVTVRLTVRR